MPAKTTTRRASTVTHRKRRGDHHKQGKHYLKVYWPYVPMLLIVVAGLFLGTPRQSAHGGILAYATEMSSSQLLSATNTQRSANGKTTLGINSKLSSAAQTKANDMAARNYWSHNTPDGLAPWYFIENAGYTYQKAGENLAYGFANSSDTVTGWMNSPSHRDNLLDTAFTEVGFGFTNSANYNSSGEETIVVAMYGTPQVAGASQAAPAPAAPQAAPAPTPAPTKPAPSTQTTPAPVPQQPVSSTPVVAKNVPFTTEALAGTEPVSTAVSRIQTATGGKTPWIAFTIGIASTIAILFMVIKHSLAFKKALIDGEHFLIQHPMLDIGLVSLVMVGYALSQTSGFIK
jgi:hypothetical protein